MRVVVKSAGQWLLKAALTVPLGWPTIAFAQSATVALPTVDVSTTGGAKPETAYASNGNTATKKASLGPLGERSIQDTPASVTVAPQAVLVNQQVQQVNDVLHFFPSVEIRDQQGFDISRPQSRGFQGSIVQNTRVDGLNIIGTTANPAENLDRIEILNGVGGALYGPETPAGVFNYVLKRPTDVPIFRYIESFDSHSIFTEQVDVGGMTGPDNRIGYRVNLVHGQGESYVKDSYVNRSLGSIALDYHFDAKTVVETNFSHYATDGTGLPGSIVYNGASTPGSKSTSTILPNGLNPTQQGLGQPGAGVNLRSDTGLVKLKHEFDNGWHLEIGGLYENAVRNLYGITNTLNDNIGDYTVTKNFTAVPRFTVASNTASLNGNVDIYGFRNEVTLGTNGFVNGMYSYKNSIAQTLGTSNLANPAIFAFGPVPSNGYLYRSGYQNEQSIITGDTVHLNDKLAVQGVLNTSFISTKSFSANGATTSANTANGALSPTVSVIYKPIPVLTTYFTYASSIEPGDTATTGTVNANQILAPYHDLMYEVGAKYALRENLLLTLDAFRMTRPFASAPASTNIFQVVGQQRNYGVEFFAQGSVSPDLSVLGGVTYIDARLQNSGVATTNNSLIVGVPHWKLDTLFDFHPWYFHGGALTAAVHYEDARAANNTNTSFANSFATLDIGARYSMKVFNRAATLRFQVINVNDARYYVSVADGNIVGSPGANTAYLGTPRTFETSLEFDF